MPAPYEDDDEEKDSILDMLSGEVDDYAGKNLKEPEGEKPTKILTLEISVTPGDGKKGEELPSGVKDEEEEEEGHDPIAHALGMCGGGCPS